MENIILQLLQKFGNQNKQLFVDTINKLYKNITNEIHPYEIVERLSKTLEFLIVNIKFPIYLIPYDYRFCRLMQRSNIPVELKKAILSQLQSAYDKEPTAKNLYDKLIGCIQDKHKDLFPEYFK